MCTRSTPHDPQQVAKWWRRVPGRRRQWHASSCGAISCPSRRTRRGWQARHISKAALTQAHKQPNLAHTLSMALAPSPVLVIAMPAHRDRRRLLTKLSERSPPGRSVAQRHDGNASILPLLLGDASPFVAGQSASPIAATAREAARNRATPHKDCAHPLSIGRGVRVPRYPSAQPRFARPWRRGACDRGMLRSAGGQPRCVRWHGVVLPCSQRYAAAGVLRGCAIHKPCSGVARAGTRTTALQF